MIVSITSVEKVFFVLLIFLRCLALALISSAETSIKETENALFHARSGNKPLFVLRLWACKRFLAQATVTQLGLINILLTKMSRAKSSTICTIAEVALSFHTFYGRIAHFTLHSWFENYE